MGHIVVETRYKRDPRQMEEEEEAWFNEEEEEFIPATATATALAPHPPPLATNTSNTSWHGSSFPPSLLPSMTNSNTSLYNNYFGSIAPAPSTLSASSYSPQPATVMSRTSFVADGEGKRPVPILSPVSVYGIDCVVNGRIMNTII